MLKNVKNKRVKRVFTSASQVLHLWSNQSQEDARCKNVFFEGKSCYSYGYHYELGRLHEVNGHTIALINDRGYSKTTDTHIAYAGAATSHLPTLYSTDLSNIDSALVRSLDEIVNDLFDRFNKLSFYDRDISWFKEGALEQVKNHNKICDIVKRNDLKIVVPNTYWNLLQAHVNSRVDKIEFDKTPEGLAKLDAKRLKRKELKEKKIKEDVEKWLVGEIETNRNIESLYPQIIRIKGNEVQTSKRASVPLNEARSLLKDVLNKRDVKDKSIGSFTVNSLKDDIIKIGCHDISIEHAKKVLMPNHLKLVA